MASRREVEPDALIVGTWIRQHRKDDSYPDELTFESDGLYTGRKTARSAKASKLDLGVFEHIDEKSVRMSTATDRDETFAVETSESELKLVDEEGLELLYARADHRTSQADKATDRPAD